MSSTAETAKQKAEGDAPEPKRVKIDENTTKSGNLSAENNNGTAKADSNSLKKNTEDSGSNEAKSSNDTDKDPEFDGEDVTGDDSDSEPMDPNVARRLQQVQGIQQRICKLNELASEEILKVEQKFNKLRRPHFEERNSLLKEVPNFWVTCLANHPTTTQLIESDEDEDCLHYMVSLDVEELEDIKSGYNLKFHFKENPYIKNDLIVKELRHLNSDEVVSKSTTVEYKDTPQARNLKALVDNSSRHFSGSGDRGDQLSFFAWMCLPCETGSDEIAEIIKDQIWPSPLEFFFLTPADEYDTNSDDDDDDDDESDEEDYDEEESIDNEGGLIRPEGMAGQGEESIEAEELDFEDDGEDDDDDDEEDDE